MTDESKPALPNLYMCVFRFPKIMLIDLRKQILPDFISNN